MTSPTFVLYLCRKHSIITEGDANRVWSCVENAIEVMMQEEEEEETD
jgi:hypothetical protein